MASASDLGSARTKVNLVMQQHPRLTYHGLEAEDLRNGLAADEFDSRRSELLGEEALTSFEAALFWFTSTRPDLRRCNSYALKHRIARELRRYISNGVAIAAAICAGLDVVPDGSGINARISARRAVAA